MHNVLCKVGFVCIGYVLWDILGLLWGRYKSRKGAKV